jgi:hypothetical protein
VRASRGLASLLALTAVAWMLAAGVAQAQAPSPTPPRVLDASGGITALTGMSIARDGTGGLAYVKGGHVFVSQLAGAFQTPLQVDAGLGPGSSQPVIAAGNGGFLTVAFINSGNLYVVQRATTSSPYSAPRLLAAGASNPAIAVTTLSKVYLAFTVAGAGGHDVRCAYYDNGSWGIEPSALDAAPGDDAGTGSARPAVAAAGDGVGIVAWGEAGHVFVRRVWGTAASVVDEQADPASIGAWTEVSADQPGVAAGGDSSYASVTFRELVASGAQQQSRVLFRRLHGSQFENPASADGVGTPGSEGADQPQVTVGEYGQGFVTSARTSSHELVAMQIRSNDTPGAAQRVDSLSNTGAAYAVPAAVGYHDTIIAWQENPLTGNAEIRARFFDGTSLEDEFGVSPTSLGATDAAAGLVADGDIAADVAIAWIQDDGGSPSVVVEQMYQPPGGASPLSKFSYVRTATPTLSWSPSSERWGPAAYTVTLSGAKIGPTGGDSIRVPTALGEGRHAWTVTVSNPTGQSRTSGPATVFVDTIPPKVRPSVRGSRTLGSIIHLAVRSSDGPRGSGSGIKQVRVNWGDGHSARYSRPAGKSHVYERTGSYRITVVATDRAGNRTRAIVRVRITKRTGHKHG